jgi:hypothetical protein
LERLEQHTGSEAGCGPFPYEALYGTLPLDELPEATRRMVERMYTRPSRTGADWVADMIAAVGLPDGEQQRRERELQEERQRRRRGPG